MSLCHFHLPKEKTRLTEVNNYSQGWTGNLWQTGAWEPGAGARAPSPAGLYGLRKGPRKRPRGPQQSAVEANIPDTLPSVNLFESLPVISNVEVRLPEILPLQILHWTVLPVANGPFNTELNVQRRKGAWVLKTSRFALCLYCPRALAWVGGGTSGPTVSGDHRRKPPHRQAWQELNPLRKRNISLGTCRPWLIQVEIIIYSVKLENQQVMFKKSLYMWKASNPLLSKSWLKRENKENE